MPLIGRENVNKGIEAVYKSANDNLRGVYLSGLGDIILGTPVDTGRARNNWFLSVGVPSNATTTSKSKGLTTIRSLRKMPLRVINKNIYLTNNLPYVTKLEYGGYNEGPLTTGGFSKQAPNGWVRSTIMKMQKKIRTL